MTSKRGILRPLWSLPSVPAREPRTSPQTVGSGGSVLRGPTSCIFKETHKC